MKRILLPLSLVSAALMAGLCPGQEPADPEWIGPFDSHARLFVSATLPEPGAHGRGEALLAAARAALAPWTNAAVRLFEVPGEGAVVFAAPFVQGSYRGPADESHPAEAALLRATRSDAFPTPPGGARPVVARGLAPFAHRQIGTNWITRTHWPEERHLRVLLADARGAQASLWHAEETEVEPHAEFAESAERKPHAESAEFSVLCVAVPCLPEELPETLDELVAEPYANLLRRAAPLAPRAPFGAVARAVFGDRGVVAMAPLAPGADTNAVLRAVRAKALDLGETTPRFAGDPFVAVRAFAPPRGADSAAFARDLARELLAEAKIADQAFNWPDPFLRISPRDFLRLDRSDSSPWNWRGRGALRAEVVRRTDLAETLDPFAEPIEAELVPGDAFRLLLPDGPVRGDFTLRLSPEHAPAGTGLALAALVSDKKNAWEEDRIVLCDPASPTGALRTALFPEDPKGGSVLALVWSPRPDADFTVYGACPAASTPRERRALADAFLANPATALAENGAEALHPFALHVRHRPGAPLPPRAGEPYDDLPLPPPPPSARELRERDLRERGIPDPALFADAVHSWTAELSSFDAPREPPGRILGIVSNFLLRAAPAFDPEWDEDLALGRALREAWGRGGLPPGEAAALFARALDGPSSDPLDAAVAELVRAAARAISENAGGDPDAAAVRVPDLGLPPALARSLRAELAALRLKRLWLAPLEDHPGGIGADNAFGEFLNGPDRVIVNGKAPEPSGPTIDDLFREAETPAERLALRLRFLRRVLALPDRSEQYAADNWSATRRECWGRREFVERMVDNRSCGKPLVEEQLVPWLRVADYIRDLRRAADAVADVRVLRTVISHPRAVDGVFFLDEGATTNRFLCPIHAIELDEARWSVVRDMGDHAGHAVASDPPEFVEAFARDLCRRAGIDDPDEVDMFVDRTDGQAADWATFGGEYGKGPYSIREGSPLAGHYARTAARRAAGRATFGKLVLRGEHAAPPPPEVRPPPPADDNGHVEPYPDPSPALRAEMARYGLRAGVFVQRGRHSWNAGDTNRLSFLFFEPTNAPAGAALPLLLFLPGSGELGPGLDAQFRQRGIYEKVCSPDFQARHPCFLLALAPDPGHPLMGYLPDGGPNDNQRAALNLVAALAAERDRAGADPRVDLSRLYGAGLSRGAGELVCIQQEVPGVFAAVATTDTAIWHTDRIPDDAPLHIWHFYRAADWEKWRYDVRWLRRYADLLPSRGGEMRVTELTDLSRASWDQAWACDEMWDWMFAQRRALPLPDWNAPRDPENPMWKARREAAKAAAADGPMEWRQWPVPWPADQTTFGLRRRERRKPAPDRTAEWKAWLAERGVRFPDGSRIRHLPFSSDLLVYAAPADQNRIHALLADLEANPFDPAPQDDGPLAAPDDGDSNEPWPECSHWPAGDRPLPDRDDEPSGAPFYPDSPDTIVHRQYSIRPSNRPGGLSASDNAEKWHDWLAEKGVAWPAGSSVSFFPTLGKLVVANTRKNLDRVEALLKSAAKP